MDRIENIDYCIRYLLKQNQAEAEIPKTLEDKKLLMRALMNIWKPQLLDIDFLRAQDAELQAQLQEKGVVTTRERVWQGDITRLKVDAIVNAANSRGLGCWHPLHACIDNAIHSAAGLQLRQECNRILQGDEIATGGAIITPGYNLPARFVIHTVGPIIGTGTPTAGQEEQLAACYRTCLYLAKEQGCRSIAFCCISTGEFHFPNRRAAEIAVNVCKEARMRVIFNVFKDIDRDIYRTLVGTH
ncbi:MAG: macro domain-containing protein [Bacteroidales bacterium]|nr:macro domain-containing protein [Bacteroidales bacterium]